MMKRTTNLLFLCLTIILISLLNSQSVAQNRTIETLTNGWSFTKGNPLNASASSYDDSDWQQVRVPHDWAISGPFDPNGDGSTAKLPWKGEGWYRKDLNIDSSMRGKKIYLIFDGVMAFPKIYINGKLAGEWDYGYNSFFIDITDFVNYGSENVLAVHANTTEHGSRWYPGAGIFRKVQMLITNPVHVDIWGTYVTTPIIKSNSAEVRVNARILNESSSANKVRIEHTIISPNGKPIATDTLSSTIKAQGYAHMERTFILTDPILWDTENPALYSVQTKVYQNGQVVDNYTTPFGIRSIEWTADDGFHLNGRRVQLYGVNLHHGHGPLGAAFNSRAMERQLEIMKSMGVNAIRNSHNVAAPELLELCDKMGLLLVNEIFDKYDDKADITEDTDFEDFAHRNIKNWVLRDRNHPSVILWSVGNEIGDVQWNINNGFQRLHTMVNYVNKYDPTRTTTLVCDNEQSAEKRHFDYYDVISYNYGRRYKLARQIEPNKPLIISESASTVSTRGFYEFPLPEEKTNFTKSLQVSSYDLNAPDWAEIGDDDFMWQQDEPYIAGEFVWTGFDYLGEPTPYANNAMSRMGLKESDAARSSYFGIVDIVGIPKDRYYLYKSYWKPNETTIHILPHWNWPERVGKNVPVFVYTNGDSGELFINGKSQGIQMKKPTSRNSTERFRLMWKNVTYEPGEVKVVVYKAGEKLGEKTISTAGEATQLKLTADRPVISANGDDLSYIFVEALDKDGREHPLANQKISINIKGNVEIAGVGNGNPQSYEPFQANYVNLFYGKAMIIVRSTGRKGEATISVSADGLKSSSIKISLN
ncbi:MAG: glycoside hydrolase family 2 protein [Cytophagia bacterium]|nr:glycoside hydrolase family 2 protein [Cytophagia bacterium]